LNIVNFLDKYLNLRTKKIDNIKPKARAMIKYLEIRKGQNAINEPNEICKNFLTVSWVYFLLRQRYSVIKNKIAIPAIT
jgi:hypothetical protein